MRVAMPTSSSKSPNNSPSEEEGGSELRRGPWTPEEDALLIHYIACRGEGRWNVLAKCSGLRRTGKSCRLRWLNYLKPDVKRGNLTLQEQLLILELHSKWGNRWSKIAQQLPGRTDNEIKNYWRTRVQKQARNLNIDCHSAAFQNVLRCFWTPRLLEKIEGSSSDVMSQNPTISPQPLTSHSTQHLSPQLIPQGPFPSVDDHTGTNSISANRDSPSLCSSESMNVSQVPEIYGYPNCPIQAICNNNSTDYSTIPRHDDMEGSLNMAYMSAVGDFGGPVGDSQMVDGAWVANDLADSLWNIDESAILRASTRGSRF